MQKRAQKSDFSVLNVCLYVDINRRPPRGVSYLLVNHISPIASSRCKTIMFLKINLFGLSENAWLPFNPSCDYREWEYIPTILIISQLLLTIGY